MRSRQQYHESLYDHRSGDVYEFDREGFVPYTLTASVICLRPGAQSLTRRTLAIDEGELAVDEHGGYGVMSEFLEDGCFALSSGHEVLVGQSSVVDYVASSASSTAHAAYPGEYVFAVLQSRRNETNAMERTTNRWREATNTPHNTHQQTARRALEDAFMVKAPESASFAPVVALQTRKIRGRSNMLVSYVAIAEDESSWLYRLDLDSINAELERRHGVVQNMIRNGEWDALPLQEKERICPSVRKLVWMDLRECILAMQSSISCYFVPVNDWQASEFACHGLTIRSSMTNSLATILRIEAMGRPQLLARAERSRRYAPQEADAELRHMIDVENHRFSRYAKRIARNPLPKVSKL